MNDFELSPDDPRLTAYALGELEGDERAAVEAAVRRDPELRAALEEIRATAAQLEAALAAEALEPLGVLEFPPVNGRAPAPGAALAQGAHRGEVVPLNFAASPNPPRVNGAGVQRRGPPKVLRFPQMYFVVGGLAAACFTVIALRQPAPEGPIATAAPAQTGAQAPVVITSLTTAPTADRASATASAQASPSSPPSAAAQAAAAVVVDRREAAGADAVTPSGLGSRSSAPVPRPALAVDVTAPAVADGLSLLQQAKAIEEAATRLSDSATPLVSPAPLAATTPSALTVGLPREAAAPLLPPTVAPAATAGSNHTSRHAVVRPPNAEDTTALLELRAAGSPAELARLKELARREAERRDLAASAAPDHPARLVAPAALRANGLAGEVRVAFTVAASGAVQIPHILTATDPQLAERAIAALREAKFEPAMKAGRAIPSRLETTIAFRASGAVEIGAPTAAQ